ncbi:MAG: hypothetical protein EBT55_05705 [Proteobacteria bacterium]|nr:hypothetical protein [Pseudomonadota bacterium]
MVKKLYITGAGASKDLNQNNLLGFELLDQIKNHRFYIYYWLIAMVVARVAKDNSIDTSGYLQGREYNDLMPNYWHFQTIVSETIFNHLFSLKENSNSQKKELIPKENCVSKEKFDNFIYSRT